MNRFIRLVGFTVIIILSSHAGAMEPEQPGGAQFRTAVVAVNYQPSQEAELMYHVLLGELAGKRGQLELALESYQTASRASDDPRLAERTAGIALFLGAHAAAVEAARRWYKLDPESEKAHQMLVLALLRSNTLDEALEQIEAMRVAGSADGQEGFATIGGLLGQVDDKKTVLQVMEAMRGRHPKSPFAHYYYAVAALATEDRQAALEGLDAALSRKPQWGQAHLLRARVLVELQDTDAAVEGLARAVNGQPNDHELRSGYARLLVGAGQLDEAQNQFRLLVEKNPDDGEALYALGLLAAETKQFDEAERYLMEVLRLGVRLMDVYFELGKLEELRGNYTKAQDWYGRVSPDQERYLSAQVRVGTMQARKGDFAAMATHMATLRRDYPKNAVALYLAEAEIFRETDHYQEAFDLLAQALEEYPDDNDLLYTRALVAERLDRIEVLEQHLRTIIEADPDNGHALNALGYTLADRTDRYQEALGYLERAIILLPEDAAVLDSMGWVKYRLGSYEASLSYLRQAYERSPDTEIAAHLSEVLWVSGHREEAREVWQRAIEEHPNDRFLLEVKGRLGL